MTKPPQAVIVHAIRVFLAQKRAEAGKEVQR
jgi:hypothetical protein